MNPYIVNRWQLYNWLKQHNGSTEGADLSLLSTREYIEGLEEWLLYVKNVAKK